MDAHGDRHAVWRILDANANRAREAARVLEEYARFVIEDPHLSRRIKQFRHHLAETLGGFDVPLAQYRDAAGDVGKELTTASEQSRSSAAAVLAAAAGRLAEALRSIEEYGKVVTPQLARRIEQLRYEAYEWSGDLQRRACPRRGLANVRLYVLLSEALCSGEWFAAARAVLDAGAQALQLREKELSDRQLLERAKRLKELCAGHGALLIINDRADVALAAHADGVHVGQDDLPVAEVRRVVGPQLLIGVSTHTVEQARQALNDAPDYLAVGPMFASTTKPQDHLAGPHTLDEVRALTSLPLVAIGGINPRNMSLLHSADAVAVCSSILSTSDVRAAAEAFGRPEAIS